MLCTLIRCDDSSKGTFGVLVAPNVGVWVACEPSWVSSRRQGFDAGKKGVSCLPDDVTYDLVWHDSPKYGHRLHLVADGVVCLAGDAEPRSACMFHALNEPEESEGCIGLGEYYTPKGGGVFRSRAIVNSGDALDEFERGMKALTGPHQLQITTHRGDSFAI